MEDSVEDEVRFHLEAREERHRRAGLSPEEAAAEARRAFGDPGRVLEECRDIDRGGARRRARTELRADLLQDVRLVARGLARSPGYALVVLLSLSVGIGVNTAAFTAIDAFWFAPVPGVTGQDRVVELVVVDHGQEEWGWTWPDFQDARSAGLPVGALAGWADRDVTLGVDDGGRRVRAAYATTDYFRVFGAAPAPGRGFLPEEEAERRPVAVLSHDLWQDEFGGDPGVVGRSVSLNREPFTVVGVAPEGFRGPRPTLVATHVWVPMALHPFVAGDSVYIADRKAYWMSAMGRMRDGAGRGEVQAAVETVFARLAAMHPETNGERTARAAAFRRFPAQNRIGDLLAVSGVAVLLVLVLLIICANLAGMTLARSAAREREIAVRLALGSGRLRLARTLMLEAVLLALVGGGVGTVVAVLAMRTVSPTAVGIVSPGVRFEVSGAILSASLALTLLAALGVGLLPALRFSRPELVGSLKDDAGGGGRRAGRIQRVAASAQAGVALAGLVLGALFFRSLDAMDRSDLGFLPEGMAVTDSRSGALSSPLMDLAAEGYGTLEEGGGTFLGRLREAMASVPRVSAVAFADGVPLDRSRSLAVVSRGDLPEEAQGELFAEITRIGEGYLAAVGATLVRGRDLAASDDPTSAPVALVTISLAERLWPGEDPVGRTLRRAVGRDPAVVATVVGVVADLAGSRAGERPPQLLVPLRQDFRGRALMVLRSEADVSTLADALRAAVRAVDPAFPSPRLMSGRTLLETSTLEQRSAANMGGGLGLMVLLLCAMGVYGVVALAVSSRTREIGVRMAMGSSRRGVLRLVLVDALRLAAPGLLGGAVFAGASAAAMRSMLLGVSPADPLSWAGAAVALLVVVLLASAVPARRASGTHPMEALRAE